MILMTSSQWYRCEVSVPKRQGTSPKLSGPLCVSISSCRTIAKIILRNLVLLALVPGMF